MENVKDETVTNEEIEKISKIKWHGEEENTVTISKDEYDELLEDQRFLYCLRAAGVDNWEGYDIAQDIRDIRDE